MHYLEQHFFEIYSNWFIQLPSGKWKCTKCFYTFICPPNTTPQMEFRKRYPFAYQNLMNNWFDEIHPF